MVSVSVMKQTPKVVFDKKMFHCDYFVSVLIFWFSLGLGLHHYASVTIKGHLHFSGRENKFKAYRLLDINRQNSLWLRSLMILLAFSYTTHLFVHTQG